VISGDTLSHGVKVTVCALCVALSVTTQDFVKFWGKFFALVLLEMIEISQGFKFFLSLSERFIRKVF
jgi:hypothetical protein